MEAVRERKDWPDSVTEWTIEATSIIDSARIAWISTSVGWQHGRTTLLRIFQATSPINVTSIMPAAHQMGIG